MINTPSAHAVAAEALPAPAVAPAAVQIPGAASVPATGVPAAEEPRLDAEKLDCYHVALEFQALAAGLLPGSERVLRDQLERASVSIVLCIAEGAGRRSRRDKARFYTMARGSAMECAAVLDLVALRSLASTQACRRGRSLLVRIIQMLTKLQARLG